MPEWLQAVLIGGVILTLVGFIWRMHELHDQERNDALWKEIGRESHEGMRKTVHDARENALIARGVANDMKERIERLERRVFNGHRREDER